MEHQYPGAISPNENMLAELMLPDQTHVRTQDWTMFFLHKDSGAAEEEEAPKKTRRKKGEDERSNPEQTDMGDEGATSDDSSDEGNESEEGDAGEGPPLMYVLNLVNTKQDNSVKRGAVVKAMAICTRHSFLHIYKPLLLLALEDYFKSPYPETLAGLYNAVNEMDLSLMPRLSTLERHILQASDVKDMFVEKFEHMIKQRLAEEAALAVSGESDSPTRPGTKYNIPRDTHEFESKVVYNDIPIPIKVPTAPSSETVGDFSFVKLIQTFGGPHAASPQPFALHPHLTTSGAYTHPIIVLINAMLTQKRIIFLGHNRPSGEVAEAVLAACALASGGVLKGFTRYAFPYTDLTKVDELLQVPGFIAGVTNPAFANHHEWWDLLCDLPAGRMKISSKIEVAPVTEGLLYFQQQHPSFTTMMSNSNTSTDATGDTAFMEDIMRSIAARHGESAIRSKFAAYTTKFTRIAAAFEESVYGASALYVVSLGEAVLDINSPAVDQTVGPKNEPLTSQEAMAGLKGHGYVWPNDEMKNRELAASVSRIEGWRNTRSYKTFISDLASSHSGAGRSSHSPSPTKGNLPRPNIDLHHVLSRLRTLRLPPAEAGAIYLVLSSFCTDYDSILELLELTPMSEAGLFYITLGLFHEERIVREAVVVLLERIRKHECGRHFWNRVGGWISMGFQRAWKERESRSVDRDYERSGDAPPPLGLGVSRTI
ncbi:Protein mesA [Endocarpon pusillum Z07020]|uniref:Protein mesA n=1 Tax=Endocarpon pusillum (strain Z07020 / HMAS-L-300199) TaxID=1263415 RepID=U1GAQ2_ENDPU|nr:Protein mesA [Endocarpon pusillum Z07020]ERF68766.1 Protein mesA [Endocarpon pusillum Z07020]